MKEIWPFNDPKNVAVITTKKVLDKTKSILYVSHDEDDGMWQFHDGGIVSEEDGRIITLEEATIIDSSIIELADLPLGWIAEREDIKEKWNKYKKKV